MNKIVFFRNAKGQEPVKELLLSLKSKAAGSKDARFNFEKIMDYLVIWNPTDWRSASPTSSIWRARSESFVH